MRTALFWALVFAPHLPFGVWVAAKMTVLVAFLDVAGLLDQFIEAHDRLRDGTFSDPPAR